MQGNGRSPAGCILSISVLLLLLALFPLLIRTEGPLKPRRLLPPGLCSGVVVTTADVRKTIGSATIALDLGTGGLQYQNPYLHHAIFDPQGEWILANLPAAETGLS
ncbi:MAG: hypothetical protein ABFD96_09865 [Armatimonadia bacterium]